MTPMKRPITADSALMNPVSKVIALKAGVAGAVGDNLQVRGAAYRGTRQYALRWLLGARWGCMQHLPPLMGLSPQAGQHMTQVLQHGNMPEAPHCEQHT